MPRSNVPGLRNMTSGWPSACWRSSRRQRAARLCVGAQASAAHRAWPAHHRRRLHLSVAAELHRDLARYRRRVAARRAGARVGAPDQVWRARHDLRLAGAGAGVPPGWRPRCGRSIRPTIPRRPTSGQATVEKAGWVLDQPPEVVRRIIRDTWGGFYQQIPEFQPGPWPWQQLAGGWPQIVYAMRLLIPPLMSCARAMTRVVADLGTAARRRTRGA